jgi:hypothetical protein
MKSDALFFAGRRQGTSSVAIALTAAFGLSVAGCESTESEREQPYQPPTPGLYGSPYYAYPLSAKVGLPVDWAPGARCIGGGWHGAAEVVTGALPPGLTLDNLQTTGHITGVPTRAGTWYLRVRFAELSCADKTYPDSTQDLEIKTEGSSAPQSVR